MLDIIAGLAYSAPGPDPSVAPLDQMFMPLDLTVSFVHVIVALSDSTGKAGFERYRRGCLQGVRHAATPNVQLGDLLSLVLFIRSMGASG
jgi:hypothetical protein